MSLLIIVPVFGQHEYTHALVGDLEREGADYLIVDNRGDYPRIGAERVTTPGTNLGWAGGSEHGFRIAFTEGYSHAMTLNNDTRLSKGFVSAFLDPRLPADSGIVGPMFDHGFPYATNDQKPEAADYVPRPQYRVVPAVEGTALMVSRECWQETGGFDLVNFKHMWGPDLELAVHARKAGFGVYTTEMAYINHFGHKTANEHFGAWRYTLSANVAMLQGLRRLHGLGAALAIMRQIGAAHDRKWHKPIPLDDASRQLTD
ncbi:glycosyltransferase family 2 protein [Mycobacterium helveticum]|uniref:Glycosyltransferase family 2 protein n=1 Tax=Mycobacterium helveticum TaxID=2592811 RepID=A0A557XW64_9MYCO|nr:glycosyltransferase family 2 protein [Mycobacterium helveticum]TVS86255.1 glycosyltransferase family 2 protein [Mycobacterium helveticum]TVS90258.1 glycosyltransferase family 2 protein [Mycobacterium helveticum]